MCLYAHTHSDVFTYAAYIHTVDASAPENTDDLSLGNAVNLGHLTVNIMTVCGWR